MRERWSIGELADLVEAGLKAQAEQRDAEQAVYGIDALDELGLHPLIQDAFAQAGYGVWPETRYPDAWVKRKKSHGMRCDVVLTHDRLPLRDPEVKGTLFGAVVDAADASEAYWLEVKTVAQFEEGEGFRRYAAELLRPVTRDVKKVWADGVIRSGGLLVVLFTRDRATAEHDLHAWHQRGLQRGEPIGAMALRGFSITERTGNAWCAVALFGVRGG